MKSLSEALKEGWDVEGRLTDNQNKPIGYLMRRKTAEGKWERAKLILSDPDE